MKNFLTIEGVEIDLGELQQINISIENFLKKESVYCKVSCKFAKIKSLLEVTITNEKLKKIIEAFEKEKD